MGERKGRRREGRYQGGERMDRGERYVRKRGREQGKKGRKKVVEWGERM